MSTVPPRKLAGMRIRRPPGRENPQRTVLSNAPIPKTAATHVPQTEASWMVHWAHLLLNTQRGRLIYSESANRSELFHCKPGIVPSGTHADCSQFYAACAKWAGVKKVTDKDYTGTLLQKGLLISKPEPGCCVIFGPGTGTHAGMATEKVGNDWWIVGFGHQGAPDRVLLSQLKAYFAGAGHPGVRYLRFS